MTSCSVYYQQVPEDTPHAKMKLQHIKNHKEKPEHFGFGKRYQPSFMPLSINGKNPPLPWSGVVTDYRIPVGRNSIATYIFGTEKNIRSSAYIVFIAKPNLSYYVSATENGSSFQVSVVESGKRTVFSKEIPKEVYSILAAPIYIPVPSS